MRAGSYLAVKSKEEQDICLLCEEVCENTEEVHHVFTKRYWETLKTLAKEWSSVRIEEGATNFVFKRVHSKIKDKETFGKVPYRY